MPSGPVSYTLYVIELDSGVLASARFRNANPDRREDKPCVYVGSTYHTPDKRFEQHITGYKANRYVRQYGNRLRPRLYRNYQGFPSRKTAEEAERRLANRLRKRGYAVWQN